MDKRKIIIITAYVVLVVAVLLSTFFILKDSLFKTNMGDNSSNASNTVGSSVDTISTNIISAASSSNKTESKNDSKVSSATDSNSKTDKDDNSSKDKSSTNVSSAASSSSKTESKNDNKVSSATSSKEGVQKNPGQTPTVTVMTPIATGVFAVGGYCSSNTEYIEVSGDGITTTKIVPYSGKDKKYFLGHIKYSLGTVVNVAAKEKNKDMSESTDRYVRYVSKMEDLRWRSEYSSIFGKNSQLHYASAIKCYTMDMSNIKNDFTEVGSQNIGEIVSLAKSVGAEPIFYIIPSSTELYPETVPSEFKKTKGVSLYEAFKKIAVSKGAKVIYPLETLKNHKNDGTGYQLFQKSDSHWSTYGSYWGTYDLFSYISNKFPAAAPRTVKEMGFYLHEMDAGDALYGYPDGMGFESTPKTYNTKLKELTNLYSLKMPTNTLEGVYNGFSSLYLGHNNSYATKVVNTNGEGLPSAVIMRDSFSKVSFDMINDRFSRVAWCEFNDYDIPYQDVYEFRPDYLIYFFSERNLLKIMVGDHNASLMYLE